jgi:hypothetical protein
VGGHDEAGEPFERMCVVAGEVAQVGAGRDEQDVDSRAVERLPRAGDSVFMGHKMNLDPDGGRTHRRSAAPVTTYQKPKRVLDYVPS